MLAFEHADEADDASSSNERLVNNQRIFTSLLR